MRGFSIFEIRLTRNGVRHYYCHVEMNNKEQDRMTKEQKLQKLLDRMAKDSRDAHALAVELYGEKGNIFAQADGDLHAMDGDSEGSAPERQKHIRLSAKGFHQLGVGAW